MAKNSQSKQNSKEDNFNGTERKILRLLYQSQAPMTTYEVAKELRISYQTAQKYLKKLAKERYLASR